MNAIACCRVFLVGLLIVFVCARERPTGALLSGNSNGVEGRALIYKNDAAEQICSSASLLNCPGVALPGEVRERFVGVGHAVHVFSLGHRRAFPLPGSDELVRHTNVDGSTFLSADDFQQPADGKSLLSFRVDRCRNLIRRTTDSL